MGLLAPREQGRARSAATSTARRETGTVDSTTTAPTRCHPHCCCTCLSAGSQIQRCSRMCQRCRRVRCRRVRSCTQPTTTPPTATIRSSRCTASSPAGQLTGISCLTPDTCLYTDAYRGNLSALVESGADTSEYLNDHCAGTTTATVEAYRRVADAAFSSQCPKPHATSYLNPWERPCDRYVHLAVGYHHYCAIDEQRALRCSGHDAYGRSSLTGQRSEITPRWREAVTRPQPIPSK